MQEPQSTKATILLIDDEPEVLAEVTAALGPAGYACHSCRDGESALALSAKCRLDLIIADINVGGESGLDICRRIRSYDELADTPVMFLSGAQIPDIIRRSHAAGGTYYLRKPFDPEVLLELVEKALWMPHLVTSQLQARESSAQCQPL